LAQARAEGTDERLAQARAEETMIKLTDLVGKAFYVKSAAVTIVREPYADEFNNPKCKCVVYVGMQFHGVCETMAQVMGALGMT
jgi:hypothetical protein